jgi:hypothetical protein
MSNYERRVGDVVVDEFGQVLLLVEIDHTEFRTLKTYDVGVSIRPKPGITVRVGHSRPVITVEELLKLAESQGMDFTTKPEPPDSELTEVQRLQRENEKQRREFEQRLAALEQKSQ